jgi:hypothetical protein
MSKVVFRILAAHPRIQRKRGKLNKEQLQTARSPLWGQNTGVSPAMDAVQAWVEKTGLCPVAPLLKLGMAPTPTLLEFCLGRSDPQPTMAERAAMIPILAQLTRARVAVPLQLASPAGEQPDFVASMEALPYLYTLRGDRNWKTPPAAVGQGRVSELARHCWEEIERNGPQTLEALQLALGHAVTEGAVLRALGELWGHLRVFPQWPAGSNGVDQPPVWGLVSRQFPKQVSMGAGMGQAAALSGLLSLYLSAVIAASDAEIVVFFSLLASQSKVREMLHGLVATRQLGRVPCEGEMLLHLKDGLPSELLVEAPSPEFPAEEAPALQRPLQGPMGESGVAAHRPIRKWVPQSRPTPRDRTKQHRPVPPARPHGTPSGDKEAPVWQKGPQEKRPMGRTDRGKQTPRREQGPQTPRPWRDAQKKRGPGQDAWPGRGAAKHSAPAPQKDAGVPAIRPAWSGAKNDFAASGKPPWKKGPSPYRKYKHKGAPATGKQNADRDAKTGALQRPSKNDENGRQKGRPNSRPTFAKTGPRRNKKEPAAGPQTPKNKRPFWERPVKFKGKKKHD